MADFRLGIDIGGSKIEIVALDRDNDVLVRRREKNPGSYDDTLTTIKGMVEAVESQLICAPKRIRRPGEKSDFKSLKGSSTLGIGIPGSHAPENGQVRNSNALWMNGRTFRKDVENLLNRDIRVENDANCFALSEAKDGAGSGSSCVIGVILGTGMGSGIVVDGHIVTGRHRIAGELGHIPLPWITEEDLPMRECFCGKKGCQERYLCGSALATDWRGENCLSSVGIVEAMEAGDESAKKALTMFVDRLARACGQMITILDPDVIVLGGGVSNISWIYPEVKERLSKYTAADPCFTAIRKNRHGDSSGVRGAAWLWGPEEES